MSYIILGSVSGWELLGPPMYTSRGIEQILYGCAGAIEVSVKEIRLQSNESGVIDVIDERTIPTKWYIENGNLKIVDMNPGGEELD